MIFIENKIKISFVSSPAQFLLPPDDSNASGANNSSEKDEDIKHPHTYYSPDFGNLIVTPWMMFSGLAIMLYVILSSIREIVQIYQQRYQYLFDPINFVSWLLYIAAIIMVSPVLLNGRKCDILFSAASLTVFLSWFNLLLYLQRFDQVGIYVVMFLEILQTLIKVLIVFSILIIAFGLAFFILLSKVQKPQPNHLSFTTIPMSLMRTFSMMLGEMDFVGTFIQPYHTEELPFPYASFTVLCKT